MQFIFYKKENNMGVEKDLDTITIQPEVKITGVSIQEFML